MRGVHKRAPETPPTTYLPPYPSLFQQLAENRRPSGKETPLGAVCTPDPTSSFQGLFIVSPISQREVLRFREGVSVPEVTQHEGIKPDFSPKADCRISQPEPESISASFPFCSKKRNSLGAISRNLLCAQLSWWPGLQAPWPL